MKEFLEKMKENNVDISDIKMVITKNEKIGNTWFPVTYYEDGTVLVDYPLRY